MKIFTTFIFLISIFSTVLLYAGTTKEATLTIKCEDMHCSGCKNKISQAINSLDGIIELNIDLTNKIISVKYDDEKTEPSKIVDKITEAGYESTIIK